MTPITLKFLLKAHGKRQLLDTEYEGV